MKIARIYLITDEIKRKKRLNWSFHPQPLGRMNTLEGENIASPSNKLT